MREQAILMVNDQMRQLRLMMTLWVAGAILVLSLQPGVARGAPESFADLAEKVSPAVVNITTTTTVVEPNESGARPILPEGSPFEDFFREFLDRGMPGGNGNRPQGPRKTRALGSGFVISDDGYIVTNNHVIDGADEIMIEFSNREELVEAKVIGTDKNTDIALLKINVKQPLSFVKFGDSDVMRVGDWVLAVGNPLGQGFSVSAGIVSQRNRALSGNYDDYLQTDAAINRGNSGGPLFNMNGEVIGVNTAILSPNGGSIGIGFSMSSAVVGQVVDQLKEYGETRRGWLGVHIQDISLDIADALGLDSTNGALVINVPDGPAKDAGVEANDIIRSFDGTEITGTRQLIRIVGNSDIGRSVPVEVLRGGKLLVVNVTLGRREEQELASNTVPEKAPEPTLVLGLTLAPLDDETRAQLDMPRGTSGLLVTAVEPDSHAFEKGLRAGDVIIEAGQKPLRAVTDFADQIDRAKQAGRRSLLLLVHRNSRPGFLALPLN